MEPPFLPGIKCRRTWSVDVSGKMQCRQAMCSMSDHAPTQYPLNRETTSIDNVWVLSRDLMAGKACNQSPKCCKRMRQCCQKVFGGLDGHSNVELLWIAG
jgi:hypothetical protein